MSANIYKKEECPSCKFSYMSGFNDKSYNRCPSCKIKYPNNNYSGTNNIHYKEGCPALMSDGRFMTNYISSNEITNKLAELNNIKGSKNIRDFIQSNGTKLIDLERKKLLLNNSCKPKISCSNGWNEFQNKYCKNWNNDNIPKAWNDDS